MTAARSDGLGGSEGRAGGVQAAGEGDGDQERSDRGAGLAEPVAGGVAREEPGCRRLRRQQRGPRAQGEREQDRSRCGKSSGDERSEEDGLAREPREGRPIQARGKSHRASERARGQQQAKPAHGDPGRLRVAQRLDRQGTAGAACAAESAEESRGGDRARHDEHADDAQVQRDVLHGLPGAERPGEQRAEDRDGDEASDQRPDEAHDAELREDDQTDERGSDADDLPERVAALLQGDGEVGGGAEDDERGDGGERDDRGARARKPLLHTAPVDGPGLDEARRDGGDEARCDRDGEGAEPYPRVGDQVRQDEPDHAAALARAIASSTCSGVA